MSKIKRAIEELVEKGLPLTNESLKILVVEKEVELANNELSKIRKTDKEVLKRK